MSVLLTGATGFVGANLLPELEARFGDVAIIVRKSSYERAQKLFGPDRKVRIFSGDLFRTRVLDQASDVDSLSSVTDLVHAAAHYDIAGRATEAYLANVVGTQNIIDLARALPGLKRIHHISTIAVSGDREGVFRESMFDVGQHFRTPYARTKFRAEDMIRNAEGPWIRRIYRLGIVVGDSQTGRISKTDGPYYFLRLLLRARALAMVLDKSLGLTALNLLPLPCRMQTELPLIPVDVAARAIAEMARTPQREDERVVTYHLTGEPVTVEEFLKLALPAYGLGLRPLALHPSLFPRPLLNALGVPPQTTDYMTSRCHFDRSILEADYPAIRFPRFADYADAFFDQARQVFSLNPLKPLGARKPL